VRQSEVEVKVFRPVTPVERSDPTKETDLPSVE